jgi:site-specific recombinase XerC
VAEKLVPVFTSGELSALERTCQGRAFAQRRDAAVIAVLKASGIRAGELAGIRYDPDDASRSDLDLQQREITVRGKAAGPGSSGSGTRQRWLWTGTSGSGQNMRRRGGLSCGWG